MPQPQRPDPAREIIDFGIEAEDFSPLAVEQTPFLDLGLPWPADARPEPEPWAQGSMPLPGDPLPEADVLVVTWTVAEHEALADVLTPGFGRNSWARYAHRFQNHYVPLIRPGAPSLKVGRLGSYFRTTIAGRRILCFKSELHLNQDGIRTGQGKATLPVRDLFDQMIDEVKPSLVITVGTAGATFPPGAPINVGGMDCPAHELGDVVITRGAKFRLSQEFANEAFATDTYRCASLTIPTQRLAAARTLLARHADKLVEPAFAPPHTKYPWPQGNPLPGFTNSPDFKIDGVDFPRIPPDPDDRFLRIRHIDEPVMGPGLRRRNGRCGARPGGRDAQGGRQAGTRLARHPQCLGSADQRAPAQPPGPGDTAGAAPRPRHAGALGGLVLRDLWLLDEREQRDRRLGDGRLTCRRRPPVPCRLRSSSRSR